MEDGNQSAWLEWVAYNLSLGVSESAILDELMGQGTSHGDALRLVSDVTSTPAYRACQKVARRLTLGSRLNEALLELESQVFDFNQIRRVDGLSGQRFHRDYYCTNRPVIIRDVVPGWPAYSKWNSEYLKREYGAYEVVYQNGRKLDDHRDCFVDHSVKTTFGEFVDSLNRAPSQDECPPYLIAHDRLLERDGFRGLLDDVVFDDRYLDGSETNGRVFFWMGSKDSSTPMHRDLGNVYLAQVKGRKSVRMVPSKQLHLMYNEAGYHSDADFDDLDLDDFPLLRQASIMEFIVEPGDFLFIPVGWWHHVRSLGPTITITGNNFGFPNNLRAIF